MKMKCRMKVVHCWAFLFVLILGLCSAQAVDEEIEATTEMPQTTVASEQSTESTLNLTRFTINSTLDSNTTGVDYNPAIELKPSTTLPSSSTTTTEASSTKTSTQTTTSTMTTTTTEKAKTLQPFIRKTTLNPEGESEEVGNEDSVEDGIEFGEPDYDEEKTVLESKEDNDNENDNVTDNKFVSKSSEITLEHIEFVQLRLKHIALSSSNNITELKKLQEEEFKLNPLYKEGWQAAWKLYYNDSKKGDILEGEEPNSVPATVPDEYHIALIAYTLQVPEMYADFNRKTREVCSGKDVDEYHYKSYFKLLLLAVQTLGKVEKYKASNRFSYRGVGSLFGLEIGQVLSFQHFVSTSSSLKVAENFAGETLFELEGPFHGTALSIRHHSYFAGENEVIFSPLQVYRVDSKHVGKHYTRYNLVPYEFKMDGESCGFEPGGNTVETFITAKTREKLGRSLFSSKGSQTKDVLGLGVLSYTVLITISNAAF